MNDDSNLTKKDLIDALASLEHRLATKITSLDAKVTGLEAKVTGLDEGLREYVHDTETRILKAFHAFSNANNIRLGHLEDFSATAGKRIAALEAADRLSELELRVAQIEHKLDRRQ